MINGSSIVEHKITAIRGVETILPKGEVIDEAPRLATYPLLEVIDYEVCAYTKSHAAYHQNDHS